MADNDPPASLNGRRPVLAWNGLSSMPQSGFGLWLSTDLTYTHILILPQPYEGHTGGLCGKYNATVTPGMMLRPALHWRRRARLVRMTVGLPVQSVVRRGRLCQPGGSAGSCGTPRGLLPLSQGNNPDSHVSSCVKDCICFLH